MFKPGSAQPAKRPRLFPFAFKKKTDELPKNHLPKIRSKAVPGPQSVKLAETLKRYECPQITFINESFPVFFDKASGANITDVDGNRFIDLTSCFGVTGVGHANKTVVEAMHRQSMKMTHGMGDVHPNAVKVELAQRLAEITPGNLSQTIFSSTGFEAVESALKTAVMHTKKTGVIAFEGAYHGLGYGTLSVTHREDFRKPFEKQVGKFGHFVPFPDARLYGNKASEVTMKAIKKIASRSKRSPQGIGAVLVEPIQGRGGIMVPPANFMKELRAFCDETKILLIADEVFTGFGRTGLWFAMQKYDVVPDILCMGKGMGGGFPISACIAPARIMYSWGASTGDAIHTSTFLGHPVGAAAALAVIKEMESKKLVERSRLMGELFRKELHKLKERHPLIGDIRGSGLMIGLELSEPVNIYATKKTKKPSLPPPATAKARQFILEALRMGIILLPSGPHHNVISITPPFVISEREITFCVSAFDKILKKISL